MIRSVPLLFDFVSTYSLEREVSDGYVEQLRVAVRLLERFAARPIYVSDLSDDLLNQFLKSLQDNGAASHTRRTRRGSLLALWREAAERGFCEPPLRVRRIKHAESIVQAYTIEDMRRLVSVAGELHGTFRATGIRKAVWWYSLILAYWDSALRLSDLLQLRRDGIASDFTFQIVQSKTGRIRRGAFSLATVQAIDLTLSEGPQRDIVWLLWGRRDVFFPAFRKLREQAGLSPRSSSKWIRRGSASAIEAQAPGTAWIHLGHARPGLDRQAYIDRKIADPAPKIPPPILPLDGA